MNREEKEPENNGEPEEVTDSEDKGEEINEDNSEQEKPISGELRDMKDYSLLAFLSYFLLIINTMAFLFIDWGSYASNWQNFFFIVLCLAPISSFSIYIYLRSNDERFEYSFWKGTNSYLITLFQIILLFLLIPFSFILLGELPYLLGGCFLHGGGSCLPGIIICLYMISLWLVVFSLTFRKKFMEITDDNFKSESIDDVSKKILVDVPKTGIGSGILEMIFGFLGCIAFVIGFLFIQQESSNFGPRYGTFADAIPFYAISFVLLILAFAMKLNAKSSSQDSAQKELIKVDNWKKFKKHVVILVVVFSLLMPLLWYENEIYWENQRSLIIDLTEDCNDEIIGPDVDLVGANFAQMKLRGCDLSNRDLTGAIFLQTNLACVDFSNSILEGAFFYSPDIRGAIFDNADLSNVDFQGETEWRNTGYSNVYCDSDISFKGANLTNVNFETTFRGNTRADSILTFDNVILNNSNFVVLAEWGWGSISFDNAILDNSNFVFSPYNGEVSMVNVSFIGTNLSIYLPPGSDLSRSDMAEANFIDFLALDLASCPFSLPETYNCAEISNKKMIFGPSMDFSNKEIQYLSVETINNDFVGSDFSGLYLPNSIFQGIVLDSSNMSNANLSNSNFTYSHKIYDEQYLDYIYWFEDTDEDNRTYIEAILEEWGVNNFSDFKSLWSANLTNVDFTGANLSYSDFSYSNMLGANLENATLTGAKWYYTICPDGTNSGKTGSCAIE